MVTIQSLDEDPSAIALGDLIDQCNRGDLQARDLLIQHLYRDLRRIAAAQLRTERTNHTLQPTALVHEAYLRLAKQSGMQLRDHLHFLALAAQYMRQFLVDYARSRLAAKRGGPKQQVTLTDALASGESRTLDVVLLDESITRLSEMDARQGRIVELHFFGGLSFDEIATVLGISPRTAKRDWAMARAWLQSHLANGK